MGITFADSFTELLYRAKFALLSGAPTASYRRDQVARWIDARLRKAVAA
jgi:hypothetical protein